MPIPETVPSPPVTETAATQPQPPVAEPAPPEPSRPKGLPPSAWVSTTYFAEGLPYMLVRALTGVYFTDLGLRESIIGYLNFLGLPWNFKFTWAPLVDWVGTKRKWMLGIQGALVAGFGLLALLVALGPKSAPVCRSLAAMAHVFDPVTGWSHRTILLLLIGLLVVLAFLSATHDVSIDAYYIEGLPEKKDQAKYTGLRVTAYRVAALSAKSALVLFAWWLNFGLGALALGVLFVAHLFGAPRFAEDLEPRRLERPKLWSHLEETLTSYLAQDRVWVILAFIPLYKVGDALLFGMNTTFLMRELHVTRPQLSWLSLLGTFAAIAGTLGGAWLIERHGLKRMMWPLTLAMNLTLWAYVYLAWATPSAATTRGVWLIAVIHVYENLAAALGDAALTIFLIYTCKPAHKAAHFAVGTAIASLASTVFGGFSGAYVEAHGYLSLYLVAFAASVPAMGLLFFLPLTDRAKR